MTDQSALKAQFNDALAEAHKSPPQYEFFSNHMQIVVRGTEFYLDFYSAEPKIGDTKDFRLVHRARVTIPVFAVKGFVSVIVRVILNHEKMVGGELPDIEEEGKPENEKIWAIIKNGLQKSGK